MISKNFNIFFGLIFFLTITFPLSGEEVDIWKNKKKEETSNPQINFDI